MLTCLLLALAFNADDSQAILQMEKQWVAAIQKPDTAALEKLLHIQLIYGHATGVTDTKASYIGKLATGKQKYAGVEQEILKMQHLGDTVIVHARMHVFGVNQSGKFDDRVMLMHTWIKREGRWQLVAHQTAKLP
ncbi:MAG: nuclear transport factor 2 family protein [Bryobacteraceae bacterium]|nr:nuclear transport factor 2 family protein [Bryobacteraceae bacterium]